MTGNSTIPIPSTLWICLALFFVLSVSLETCGQESIQVPEPSSALMCAPGQLLFSEDFDPKTVSNRWGFKADFALRDGALVRSKVDPKESKRVFLKDPSFHNVVVQFDFKLSGQTTDLRLVTGSGGSYNSVTQVRSDYFQVNTASDRDAGIVSSHLGECVRTPHTDKWQTITVEYWDDEIVAHLNDKEFVLGRHPIVDRAREYFAFQFDAPGAAIDKVRIWKAVGQKPNWKQTRQKLASVQSARGPVKRDLNERYKYEYTNLKSRLTLNDPAYRNLVAKHDSLKSALHADYPAAFASHKQLSKLIAKKKKELRETEPEFKTLEREVHQASRAEDNYVLSTQPEIARLKSDGIPRQRYISELGQIRSQLEAAGDKQLADLVKQTAQRQADLEARFPEAFKSVDAEVGKRNVARKALNNDPEFQKRNRLVVDAGKAIKEYELKADPELAKLADELKKK